MPDLHFKKQFHSFDNGLVINNGTPIKSYVRTHQSFMQRMSYMVVNVFLLFADSSDNKEKKSFSLEEKSKTSKNRVHYMKFTKGKSRHSPGEVCMLALGFLSHCDPAQCYSMGCLFEVLNGAVWSAWWVDLRQPWVARAQCPC